MMKWYVFAMMAFVAQCAYSQSGEPLQDCSSQLPMQPEWTYSMDTGTVVNAELIPYSTNAVITYSAESQANITTWFDIVNVSEHTVVKRVNAHVLEQSGETLMGWVVAASRGMLAQTCRGEKLLLMRDDGSMHMVLYPGKIDEVRKPYQASIAAAMDPAGRRVMSIFTNDGQRSLFIHDPSTGELLYRDETPTIDPSHRWAAVTISNNVSMAALVGESELDGSYGYVYLFDMKKYAIVDSIKIPDIGLDVNDTRFYPRAMSFSPSGKHLAVGGKNQVFVWEVGSKELRYAAMKESAFDDVAMPSDSVVYATGSFKSPEGLSIININKKCLVRSGIGGLGSVSISYTNAAILTTSYGATELFAAPDITTSVDGEDEPSGEIPTRIATYSYSGQQVCEGDIRASSHASRGYGPFIVVRTFMNRVESEMVIVR